MLGSPSSRITRRRMLTLGSLGLAGAALPKLLWADSQRRDDRCPRTSRRVHSRLSQRRAQPSRHVGREARCAAGNPRRVQVNRHVAAECAVFRTPAAAGAAHASQRADSLGPSPGGTCARGGGLYDADRARPRRHHGDYPHRAQTIIRPSVPSTTLVRPPKRVTVPFVSLPYATAEGVNGPPQAGFFGGMLGKGLDPLLVLKDPNAPDFAVPELSLPSDVADRPVVAAPDRCWGRWTANSANATAARRAFASGRFSLLSSPATQRAFQTDAGARQGPRRLWPQHLRAKRPLGPPTDRSRHARRFGRLGPRRQRDLGHALGHVQSARQRTAAAARHGARPACWTTWSSGACSSGRWSW